MPSDMKSGGSDNVDEELPEVVVLVVLRRKSWVANSALSVSFGGD